MPTVLIAQAIGRWGNFMNQEAYGQIMSSERMSALPLPEFIKDGMFIDGAYRQPTFLYESLLNIIGFFIIVFLVNKFLKKTEVNLLFILFGMVSLDLL